MRIRIVRLALVTLAVGVVGYLIAKPRCRRDERYCGNELTRVFHEPSCRYARAEHGTAVFANRQEAVDAGYEPCRVCEP